MATETTTGAAVKNGKGKKGKNGGKPVTPVETPTEETVVVTFDMFDVTISRLTGGRWRLAIEGGADHPTLAGEVLTVQTMKSCDGIDDTVDGLLAELCADDTAAE